MTHNSWSFLRPRTFLGRIFNFMAKCQSKNIQEQYENYNVRMFDLRVRLENGHPIICHGLFEYQYDQLENDLDYLNNKKDVYVRIFLEVRTPRQDTDKQRIWFLNYCKSLEQIYENIKFCGGGPTYSGSINYYKFKYNCPTSEGCHASWATYNKLDDLWPWLYAKLHNKESREKGTDYEFLSLDFVEI